MTFTGNVVLGAEAVTPPPSLVRPQWTMPADSLTLQIPVGGGSTLGVPLNQELLLGGLQRRRDVTSDAFSTHHPRHAPCCGGKARAIGKHWSVSRQVSAKHRRQPGR